MLKFSGLKTTHNVGIVVPTKRTTIRVFAEKKGFGASDGGQSGQKSQIKVSKRGKVATRPDQKAALERLKAEQREYEEQLAQRQAGKSPAASTSSSTSSSNVPWLTPTAPAGDDDDYNRETVPTEITDRMLQRIVLFAGAPIMLGLLLLPGFWYLKVKQHVDFPNWIPVLTQSLTFGAGLAGISYGILSTSWDARREGTFWGLDEFKANLPIVMERFKPKN